MDTMSGAVRPSVARLDIVIVNWNAGRRLIECLESVAAAGGPGVTVDRVVVVDNGSADGSLDRIERIPLPLTVIRNGTNRGFAAACNQGARGSEADHLLFLNPDTRLFAGSLARPVAFLEDPGNASTGIAGIQLVDETGAAARTCARFPTPGRFLAGMLGLPLLVPGRFPGHFMTEWDHAETRAVDQVMGAFFLVRRALFEALGGFDERFFVYFEEVDFCLRARKAGWGCAYLAGSRAYHEGGGSSHQVRGRRLFYFLRSRILYGCKHFGTGPATGLFLGTLLVEPIARLVLGAARGPGAGGVKDTLESYGMLWRDLPGLVRAARRPPVRP